MTMLKRYFAISLLVALSACNTAEDTFNPVTLNTSTLTPTAGTTRTGMVVTANPLATDVGVAVLEAGGSAVDAAIAIEAVLSLVEPQSSGLGGGGFMLHYHNETNRIDVYDGRETAPAGATPDMFLDSSGNALGFLDAKNSGVSIGVPGMVSLLALAHRDHGTLPWSSLFDPAIELAEEGFQVSPRLTNFLNRFKPNIPDTPEEGPTDLYQYFYNHDGSAKETLANPDYANSLRLIGENAAHFYQGDLARQIVSAANAEPRAGTLSLDDLANYQARKL